MLNLVGKDKVGQMKRISDGNPWKLPSQRKILTVEISSKQKILLLFVIVTVALQFVTAQYKPVLKCGLNILNVLSL